MAIGVRLPACDRRPAIRTSASGNDHKTGAHLVKQPIAIATRGP
jgi:hypothetical protein